MSEYFISDEARAYLRKSLDKFSQEEQEELRQAAREFERLLADQANIKGGDKND